MKRTYHIQKIYVVICSECNENITERANEPTTRAEAERCKRDHEALHRYDERPELAARKMQGG